MADGEFGETSEMVIRHQIERRFRLVDSEELPDRSQLGALHTSVQLEQGYLSAGDDEEVRLRAVDHQDFSLTQKTGSGLDRKWQERQIDESEFEQLWPETEGSRLAKTRYYIPLESGDGKVVELDFFEGALTDFVLAEVKFSDIGEAQQFVLPDWLQRAGLVEVTDVLAFQNRNLAKYKDFKDRVVEFEPDERPLPTIDPDRAHEVFNIILDATKNIYSLYRREERQIFGNSAGHGPQETDAEHSWHVTFLLNVLWQNRGKLGIDFGKEFNITSAMQLSEVHDLPEIWTKDVDAVSKNRKLIENKDKHSIEAIGLMVAAHPYLNSIGMQVLDCVLKHTPEAKLDSDLDKFSGALMIICDGGKKWREQVGNTTSRERHNSIIDKRILTPFGEVVWNEFSRYFDQHPELFAPETVRPLISSGVTGNIPSNYISQNH